MSAEAARAWLAKQPEQNLRIAREIISRRAALAISSRRNDTGYQASESGVLYGLRLALSYLGDRPGDISQTGAEGFICDVEMADEMIAEEQSGARQ